MSGENIVSLAARLSGPDELGALKEDDEEIEKPWEPKARIGLTVQDFPKEMALVRANMIFIPKTGISQKGLNAMKRLAAFKNPEFYKAQAMRLSTYGKDRIISCCDETPDYLCLPRGCEGDIAALCTDAGITPAWLDKTQKGKSIQVDFNGILRDEQCQAVDELLKHENGVLSATTAFGKTVIAAKLDCRAQGQYVDSCPQTTASYPMDGQAYGVLENRRSPARYGKEARTQKKAKCDRIDWRGGRRVPAGLWILRSCNL